MKKWYKSKTVLTNIGIILSSVGAVLSSKIDWQEAAAPIVLALINIILRFVTKKPITIK